MFFGFYLFLFVFFDIFICFCLFFVFVENGIRFLDLQGELDDEKREGCVLIE